MAVMKPGSDKAFSVVPAKAGTHTPFAGRSAFQAARWQIFASARPGHSKFACSSWRPIGDTAYGSPLSRGRPRESPPRGLRALFARLSAALLAVVVSFISTSPTLAQTSLADLAFYDGPDRTQKLIDGAKKEGSVSIYSSMTVDDTKIVTGGFEKKYGIKVSAWRGSSEDILRRAVVEARGGRYDVDVIETSAAEMESLHRERLLQEVKTPLLSDIVPSAIRPHREWVGDRLNIISAGYNTGLVKPADVPKSYADLL